MEVDPAKRQEIIKALREAQKARQSMSPEEQAEMKEQYAQAMTEVDPDFVARQGRLQANIRGAELTKTSLRKGKISFPLRDLSIFLSLSNEQWSEVHNHAFHEFRDKPQRQQSDFGMFVREVKLAKELFEREKFPLKYLLSTQLNLNCEKVE